MNTYQTYLLRLYRRRPTATQNDERTQTTQTESAAIATAHWQLVLVHPYSGARRTFDSLEALTLFLQEQMGES